MTGDPDHSNSQDVEMALLRQRVAALEQQVESLSNQNHLLTDLLFHAPVGIFVKDCQGRYIQVSQSISRVLNLDMEQIIGKTAADLFPADIAAQSWETEQAILATGKSLETELVLSLTGIECTLLLIKFPLYSAEGNIYAIGGIATDITERKRIEEQLQRTLQDNQVLLREVYHRVKNNLQIVSSLLDLQSAKLQDPAMLDIFHDARGRLRSMALIHEALSRTNDPVQVDMMTYLNNLLVYLRESYITRSNVSLHLDSEAMSVASDIAIPCGLIINELVTNALKHAFPSDQSGTITVTLHASEDNQAILQVRDNGVGLADSVDFEHPPSTGLQLVHVLARQLRATIVLERQGGTCITLTFPTSLD